MQKTFCALLFLLCIPYMCIKAQKKKNNTDILSTACDAMAAYDFDVAIDMLETDISQKKKRKKSTEQAEQLLSLAHRNLTRLKATERVTIIDSVIVEKEQVLNHLYLSNESGSLHWAESSNSMVDTLGSTIFKNQLKNHIVFAQKDENGYLSLYESELIGKEWSKPSPLRGIKEEDVEENFNYPFMLTDGLTLYYAAKGTEGLGGYDIYMTRYDAESQEFLIPENIGMPFNSSANDYLYTIDEYHNIGWFATDRNMPKGKVCVYTFIPNESRKIYNEIEIGMEQLKRHARILSIAETWENSTLVHDAKERLTILKKEQDKKTKDLNEFYFVLNDKKICRKESDFISPSSKELIKKWITTQKEIEATKGQLTSLRDKYAKATIDKRQEYVHNILSLETELEKDIAEKKYLEKEIRRNELRAN